VLARWAPRLLAASILGLTLWALDQELRSYHFSDIMTRLAALPGSRVVTAIALTMLGHLVHVGYDALALRYAGRPLPWRRVAFGSLITYSVSAATGFTGVIGASLRYRFWSAWGVPPVEILKGVSFAALTAGLGAIGVAGSALTLHPAALSLSTGLPVGSVRGAGLGLLAVIVAYGIACVVIRRPIRLGRLAFQLPTPPLALAQIIVATLDWAIAGWVFFVLLPPAASLPVTGFLSLFVAAQAGGLLAHVPAGLGVFDTVILLLLRPYYPSATGAAALIAYRGVAYLLPFLAAALALGGFELRRRPRVIQVAQRAQRWIASALPSLLSVTAFLAGCMLLASGATPGIPDRLAWLGRVLPLGVIEAAHFVGSLAGVALLVLARGLHRRLDAAYHLTLVALVIGIGSSLLKGGDYEEAVVLATLLVLVIPARARFNRRAELLSGTWSPGWLLAVTLALAATTWLGLFSYRHVAYTHDLWWQFALDGDAPRLLRAGVGAAVLISAAALWHMLGPSRVMTPPPDDGDIDRAAQLAYRSGELSLYLALLRDKSLLFGPAGGALMYSVSGRSWIALGDPIGSSEDRSELVWRLKELADRHNGWPVFYEVGAENLPLYVELGLTLIKVGEAGRVPLAGWELEQPAHRRQRRTLRALDRAGCSFEVIPADGVRPLLPELRRISDAWLSLKHTREKGFSLGAFDEEYLCRFPAAVVRNDSGIVAFANLWLSGTGRELSLDLMRYDPAAPHGVMEYVLTNLFLWGKAQGYAWFNLGMAPLSGLESRALAPLWSRLGALAFRHGEHFYNFRGLRQYKEQFGPVWEPRFLAVPSRLALPRVLSNLATLISGGLTGVIAK
jgi:phosphatidylglycerol lysyltransferase